MNDALTQIPPADAQRLRGVSAVQTATAITRLGGGITNRNYHLVGPTGEAVVRLSDPDTSDLAIDREHEYLNSVAAHASGAAPAVVEYHRGAGVLVIRWIHGRTFSVADVRNPANLPRIAEVCRRLHSGPAFTNRFDMFAVQARYLDLVRARGYRIPTDYLDHLPKVELIRTALAAHPEPLVPCNNDLLAENIIDTGDRLWLIDYEYSGANEASFELGNIWSESTLPDDLLEPLITAYWGRPDPAKVARARLWALMSKYGWTLWASIQDGQSTIDFDYWSWGMEKYERAVAEFASSQFAALLDAAGGAEIFR